MAANATFALKAGVWFRRGRLFMVSPDSQGTACPLSGRNSTYRPVQISGTGSVLDPLHVVMLGLRCEFADRHVFDHALTQRADCLLRHADAPVSHEAFEPLTSCQ